MISKVLRTIALACSNFLTPTVFALLYSVQGGLAQITSKVSGSNIK